MHCHCNLGVAVSWVSREQELNFCATSKAGFSHGGFLSCKRNRGPPIGCQLFRIHGNACLPALGSRSGFVFRHQPSPTVSVFLESSPLRPFAVPSGVVPFAIPCLHPAWLQHKARMASQDSSSKGMVAGTSVQRSRPLAVAAKRSYLQFLWGTSFGVLMVLATPLVTLGALVVAFCKHTHDSMARWRTPAYHHAH